MSDGLKFIVKEINKLFTADYNMISFDSLESATLIKILCDVLQQLQDLIKIYVDNNLDVTLINIMNVLQMLKYSPPSGMNINDLWEGIIKGNHDVIYPILFWLLSNQNNIKNRAYLAKYLEKVNIPEEILPDSEVASLFFKYETLIQEFWKTYTDYKRQKKNATETSEFQKDIEKISYDNTKLTQRLEQQKEKVANIPNKEALLVIIRAFRNEEVQFNKLQQQIKQQKVLETRMDNEIQQLSQVLSQRQNRPKNVEPLEKISNQLLTNRILTESQLPEQIELLNSKKNIYITVANQSEPTQGDFDDINHQVEKLLREIKELTTKKLAHTSNKDEQLILFKNQSVAVANKKQQLSSRVMQLKEELNEISTVIIEKQNVLHHLIGGPLLQGEELKQFVNQLREQSVVYKQRRALLQGFSQELATSTRTFEIIKLMDPNVDKMVSSKQNAQDQIDDVPTGSREDLKIQLKNLLKETTTKRSSTVAVREKLVQYRKDMEDFSKEHYEAKNNFEMVTSAVNNEVELLEANVSSLKENINSKEDKWKMMTSHMNRKQDILDTLAKEIIAVAHSESPKQLDELKKKLLAQQAISKRLRSTLEDYSNSNKYVDEQQHIIEQMIMFLNNKIYC